MLPASQGSRSSVPIRSPVAWALLGLVIERPGYGYELGQRLEREYDERLPVASGSHVYQALDSLEDRGFVQAIEGGAAGRQPRLRYRATDEGKRAYRDWLIAQVPQVRGRSSVFARQLAALASEPQLALEVIGRYERACLAEAQDRAGAELAGTRRSTQREDTVAEALQAECGRLSIAVDLPLAHFARDLFTAKIASDDRA